MIDLKREKLLTLKEAAASLPGSGGQPSSYTTLWRWVRSGHNGIRLEAMKLGGRWVTSLEAIQRFMEDVTNSEQPPPPVPRFDSDVRRRLWEKHVQASPGRKFLLKELQLKQDW